MKLVSIPNSKDAFKSLPFTNIRSDEVAVFQNTERKLGYFLFLKFSSGFTLKLHDYEKNYVFMLIP